MIRLSRPVAAALLLACAARAAADDWPRWLGPQQNGVSRETGWLKEWPASGPPVLWRQTIGEGYSALVTAKGRLIVFHRAGDENHVDCLDALTGARRWRFSYPTDYTDRYGYSGGPRCCPLIEDGRVYTLDPKGVLQALDFERGEKLWRIDFAAEHKVADNFFGHGATPLIAAGVLYCQLGGVDHVPGERVRDGWVFAIEASTGKVLWKSATDGGSYASPVRARIDAADHLFVFHRGGLSDFDPRDGKERWEFPWHAAFSESVNAATPLVVGDILFFSATYRTGSVCLRVRRDDYQVLWKDELKSREKVLDIHWTPPNYLDGHVYAFSGRNEPDAVLKCVELETGKVKWEWRNYLLRGSMVYSDGHFIALGEWGDLALLKLSPEGHEEVARVRGILERPSWTVPTLSNGLLYLRDLEKLICLDLRGKGEGE